MISCDQIVLIVSAYAQSQWSGHVTKVLKTRPGKGCDISSVGVSLSISIFECSVVNTFIGTIAGIWELISSSSVAGLLLSSFSAILPYLTGSPIVHTPGTADAGFDGPPEDS